MSFDFEPLKRVRLLGSSFVLYASVNVDGFTSPNKNKWSQHTYSGAIMVHSTKIYSYFILKGCFDFSITQDWKIIMNNSNVTVGKEPVVMYVCKYRMIIRLDIHEYRKSFSQAIGSLANIQIV
jgi:hypothetical protein